MLAKIMTPIGADEVVIDLGENIKRAVENGFIIMERAYDGASFRHPRWIGRYNVGAI